jgi:transcriptional regulator with XRE-family HTH domain
MDLAPTETESSQQLLKGLGNAVVTRRLQLNVSQDDLCKSTGVNRSLIVRVESALVDVDVNTLHRIALALDISVYDLLEMAELELRT